MKLFFLFSALLTLFANGLEQYEISPDALDLKIKALRGNLPDSSWSEEDRAEAIKRLLARLDRFSEEGYRSQTKVIEGKLITLGHSESVQKALDRLQSTEGPQDYEFALTEEALPLLMPLVYTSSPEKPERNLKSDVILSAPRDHIWTNILTMIQNSEVFPKETCDWANKMINLSSHPPHEKRIDLLKQWWEHNKTAITEKRYADATWLPMYKGKPSYLSDEEVAEREAEQEQHRISRREKQQPTANEIGSASPSFSDSTIWISLIASLVLLMGFIAWNIKIKGGNQ